MEDADFPGHGGREGAGARGEQGPGPSSEGWGEAGSQEGWGPSLRSRGGAAWVWGGSAVFRPLLWCPWDPAWVTQTSVSGTTSPLPAPGHRGGWRRGGACGRRAVLVPGRLRADTGVSQQQGAAMGGLATACGSREGTEVPTPCRVCRCSRCVTLTRASGWPECHRRNDFCQRGQEKQGRRDLASGVGLGTTASSKSAEPPAAARLRVGREPGTGRAPEAFPQTRSPWRPQWGRPSSREASASPTPTPAPPGG